MKLPKLNLCLICLIGITISACGQVKPVVEGVNPDDVWKQFIVGLSDLHTYAYSTEMTSYRNLISNEAYQTPQQASISGSGDNGRIVREFLGDRGGALVKQLIISGVVYEVQIQADLQEKWMLAYVPDTPTDIGQPFILAELIEMGAKSKFDRVDESGAYTFILTVPQHAMADWLDAQYTASLDAFLQAGKELTNDNKQAFKSLYDLLAVEQTIVVKMNDQGSLLATVTTIRRATDQQPVDQTLYKTTFVDINLNTISILAP